MTPLAIRGSGSSQGRGRAFAANVEAGNQAPVAVGEIAAQTVTAGDSVTVDVAGNFSDPDGDDLTFTAATSDDAVATVSVSDAAVTIMGVAAGSATVTVTATDPGGLSATQEFGVTVEAANQAPVAVGEIPALTLLEEEEFTAPIDQFFSDPDGDTLTYAATSSDTTVVTDTLTLDVSDNFADPDGDELTFTAESDDTTVATVAVDGSTVSVVAVGAGASIVGVTASDPGGLSAAQTFAATVAVGNLGPMAVGEIAAQTVTVGESVSVDVSGNFSDPNDDELTYTAASSDEAVATASVSGAEVTITGVAAGSATVTVTATDPGGLSATQEIAVTVSAANSAPEAVDTVPVHDVFITLDSVDMTMTDTVTKVVLDLPGPSRRAGRHLPPGGRRVNQALGRHGRRLGPRPPEIRKRDRDQQLTPPEAGAAPTPPPGLTPAHRTAPPPPSPRSRRGCSGRASSRTSTARPPSAPTARPPTRSGPGPCPRAGSAR